MSELGVERLVEPQLGAQPGECLGIGALADHRLDRVAGRDVEQEKGHREHAEQRRHQPGPGGRG